MTNTTTATKLEGTCPACFRTMALDSAGLLARHGWQEQGGRKVGSYGNAWHTGACFGVGWKPFEVSPEGTIAFVSQVVFPMTLAAQNERDRIATRPAIVVEFATTIYIRCEPVSCPWSVRLQPGDEESTIGEYPNRKRVPSYEKAWTAKLEDAERRLAGMKAEGADLCQRIETWTPGTLAERDTAPTVHFKAEGAKRHACAGSAFSRGLKMTADRALVTCSRCLKSLASSDAHAAQVEGEKADAAALTEHLRAAGAQTMAQIKKALGWDTKRANKAIERATSSWNAVPTVSREYPEKGPNTFAAK